MYDPIVNGFTSLPGDIGNTLLQGASAAAGMFGTIGKDLVNGVIDGLNDVINIIDNALNGLSFFGFHPFSGHTIPDIPKLATGTQNFAGGLAMVGEKGPELVYLPQHSAVIPNNQLGTGGGAASAATQTGHQITVNAQTNANPHEIASEIGWKLRIS